MGKRICREKYVLRKNFFSTNDIFKKDIPILRKTRKENMLND